LIKKEAQIYIIAHFFISAKCRLFAFFAQSRGRNLQVIKGRICEQNLKKA